MWSRRKRWPKRDSGNLVLGYMDKRKRLRKNNPVSRRTGSWRAFSLKEICGHEQDKNLAFWKVSGWVSGSEGVMRRSMNGDQINDKRRYKCWLLFQIKVIGLCVFLIWEWLREVVWPRERALIGQSDAEKSGMKLWSDNSPGEDMIGCTNWRINFEKKDSFLPEQKGRNGGERYGNFCRCWGRKLRNICPSFQWFSVISWKKGKWVLKRGAKENSKILE